MTCKLLRSISNHSFGIQSFSSSVFSTFCCQNTSPKTSHLFLSFISSKHIILCPGDAKGRCWLTCETLLSSTATGVGVRRSCFLLRGSLASDALISFKGSLPDPKQTNKPQRNRTPTTQSKSPKLYRKWHGYYVAFRFYCLYILSLNY